MFEIGIVTQFEAAHRLKGDFGPATRLHGHTYRVEVSVRGEALREDGTLFDIGVLQRAAGESVGRLHYRDLDEIQDLSGQNTTAEVLARHLFQQVAASLGGQGLSILRVQIWESPQAYAACEGELD
jgi:6-pyruvoyltetrahydropterin/6-carboxytetrahydropterin synthase